MVAKQVADLITFCRSLLVVIFPWIALTQGERSLPWAAVLLAADWTGDSIDGTLARRSRLQYHTWIGDHDLEVDIAVSLGLLLYMLISGYLKPLVGILYLLFWLIFFLRSGIPRSLGMLFQAPIYSWFIYVALVSYPMAGLGLAAWIAAAVIVTWPKFPREVVPGFLGGMGQFLSQDKIPDE
ncbi:MAG: CDP-alcohol phosphatidyltransferase family protein [Anaerolineales bacterium]|jgi:phosphatidylglycerophosphate synthase